MRQFIFVIRGFKSFESQRSTEESRFINASSVDSAWKKVIQDARYFTLISITLSKIEKVKK